MPNVVRNAHRVLESLDGFPDVLEMSLGRGLRQDGLAALHVLAEHLRVGLERVHFRRSLDNSRDEECDWRDPRQFFRESQETLSRRCRCRAHGSPRIA